MIKQLSKIIAATSKENPQAKAKTTAANLKQNNK